jgi:hypothetical protein
VTVHDRAGCDPLSEQWTPTAQIALGERPDVVVGFAVELGTDEPPGLLEVRLPASAYGVDGAAGADLAVASAAGVELRDDPGQHPEVCGHVGPGRHQVGQAPRRRHPAHHEQVVHRLAVDAGDVADPRVDVGREPSIEGQLAPARCQPLLAGRLVQEAQVQGLLELERPGPHQEHDGRVGLLQLGVRREGNLLVIGPGVLRPQGPDLLRWRVHGRLLASLDVVLPLNRRRVSAANGPRSRLAPTGGPEARQGGRRSRVHRPSGRGQISTGSATIEVGIDFDDRLRPEQKGPIMHTRTWHVYVHLFEEDQHTRAEAVLRIDAGTEVRHLGSANRHPLDRDVPEIGDELAASRALNGLAHDLLEATVADVWANAPSGDRPTIAAG